MPLIVAVCVRCATYGQMFTHQEIPLVSAEMYVPTKTVKDHDPYCIYPCTVAGLRQGGNAVSVSAPDTM